MENHRQTSSWGADGDEFGCSGFISAGFEEGIEGLVEIVCAEDIDLLDVLLDALDLRENSTHMEVISNSRITELSSSTDPYKFAKFKISRRSKSVNT